ncbi:hypothetical protein M8312_13335 [Sphingomonas sp. KRR8]|uniref:hypothetical protein n=1 Tax=Sphingomonas sp. KRR8 TaxID=2942996 RepID=UPI0020216C44|nr:hypothetical protein [Sphingomonas sp. KRR8]URD60741.1 hypothetical protein M8312_13335 [Sphingomonas sp. KRR8]
MSQSPSFGAQARSPAEDFQAAAEAVDRGMAALLKAAEEFQAGQGERRSVELLLRGLCAAGTSRPPIDPGVPRASALNDSLLWLAAIRDALSPDILIDLEKEAQDGGAPAAVHLLDAVRDFELLLGSLGDAHGLIAATLPQEDQNMATGQRSRPTPPIQVRVTTTAPGGTGAPVSKVQQQLVTTLDSLGLPHHEGILDGRGAGGDRLVARLVDTLDRRFALRDDPLGGYRATLTRAGAFDRSGVTDGPLAGRLAIASQLAVATTRQIGVMLDDLLTLAQSIETWPLTDSARIDSARARVEAQLDRLRDLAGRAGGPPRLRCKHALTAFAQALGQQFIALGLLNCVPPAGWSDLRSRLDEAVNALGSTLAVTTHDELKALVEQLFEQSATLRRQLTGQEGSLQRSEASYHLRTIFEAVATQVDGIRAAMDDSPAAAAWVGARLRGEDEPPRYLADELDEALDWLAELADSFGLSDRAYADLRPEAVRDIHGALGTLASVIGNCRGELRRLDVPEDDDLVERMDGLQQLIGSAQDLTRQLTDARGGPTTSSKKPPKTSRQGAAS